MRKCEEIVGGPAEIEWAQDDAGIRLLQARPLAVAAAQVPDEIWLKHPGLNGHPSGIGWGEGRACIVNCECELERVGPGDVLVTTVAGPALSEVCRMLREWWRSSAAAPRISLRSHASAASRWCSACSTRPPHSRRVDGRGRRRGRRRSLDAIAEKGEAVAARAKVVITDYVWESLDVERKTLGELAEIVALKTKKPEEFLTEASDCDALLNTYAGPITAEAMAGMPKCKIIARYGIGVDTIDLDAATRAGIIVTNNPPIASRRWRNRRWRWSSRRAQDPFYDRMVRAGRWEVPPGKPIYRLAGRTLGLIGFGNIARQVAVRAAAFGLDVLYSDPFVKEGQFKVRGKAVDLDTLLRDSDFVSLHPPLTRRRER